MGGIQENVEAPRVVGVLVAGKPDVPLFRNETDQQCSHGGDAQPKGREHHEPIPKGIDHPDAGDFLPGDVKGGLPAQLQGVEDHSIEVPCHQPRRDIKRKFCLVALVPWAALFLNEIFQFFHEFGRTEHQPHLLSM